MSSSSSFFDTVDLIREVEQRPALWAYCKDKDVKDLCWEEVCEALFPYFRSSNKEHILKLVHQRWKTARDAYIRKKRMASKCYNEDDKSRQFKYVYFENLKFLEGRFRDYKDQSPYVQNQDVSTVEVKAVNIKPEVQDCWVTCEVDLPNEPEEEWQREDNSYQHEEEQQNYHQSESQKEMVKVLKENYELLRNDDMAFFLSVLPMVKNFSLKQKIHFRSEVLKKILKISSSRSVFDDSSHVENPEEDPLVDTAGSEDM